MKHTKITIGEKYGKLTVLSKSDPIGKERRPGWICMCDCGKECTQYDKCLKSGHSRSCGCLVGETFKKTKTKHGHSDHSGNKSPEYRTWLSLKQRCNYENHIEYHRYGAVGIKVCERWNNSFQNFFEDMGKKPSKFHSIDRIDGRLGYFPSNCRWATSKEQSRNKSNSVFVVFNGSNQYIGDVASTLGITHSAAYQRMKKGKLVEVSK